MDVRLLHLGPEIMVTRVVKETDEFVTVERPTIAIMDPMGGGVALVEPIWSVASPKTQFDIKKSVLCQEPLTVVADLENAYLKATTKIDIPGTSTVPPAGGPQLVK